MLKLEMPRSWLTGSRLRILTSSRRDPRSDALFRDPHSRQLAGAFGAAVAENIGSVEMIANSIAVRTAVLDRLIPSGPYRNNHRPNRFPSNHAQSGI
jgi:hypothetical protein